MKSIVITLATVYVTLAVAACDSAPSEPDSTESINPFVDTIYHPFCVEYCNEKIHCLSRAENPAELIHKPFYQSRCAFTCAQDLSTGLFVRQESVVDGHTFDYTNWIPPFSYLVGVQCMLNIDVDRCTFPGKVYELTPFRTMTPDQCEDAAPCYAVLHPDFAGELYYDEDWRMCAMESYLWDIMPITSMISGPGLYSDLSRTPGVPLL